MPIEVQKRELDAKLVVAALAVARGYKVLIGQDQAVRRLARFLPKGVLFDKSIGGRGDKKVYRYNRLGYKVTAMDEEATGFHVRPDLFMQTRMADDTLALTTRWFCISESVRQTCIERYPHHKDCFVTTGLGRTDTWREPLIEMYRDEADAIKKQFGKFVLFNSNFGVSNHARGERFVAKQIKKIESMYDEGQAEYDRLLKENAANREAYLAVLPKILDWLPEHKVVVRPHPTENIEYWSEKFKGEPRIVVQSERVVTPWIMASDFLLHHGCTTGIEAQIMGLPQVNYAPVPDLYHDTEMARAFSKFVHTEEKLKEAILDSVHNKNPHAMPAEGQAKYFASLRGDLVATKIVDEFDSISFSSKALPDWLPVLKYTPRNLVAIYKDISQRAKAYSNQKFQGVTCEELDSKLKFVSDSIGGCKPMAVREVFRNLYEIKASGQRD